MIEVFLLLWIICALLIIIERRTVRIIIYLGVFSLFSSICFFMLAAPDAAMAEVVVSVFVTLFFIICLEKYYDLGTDASDTSPPQHTTSMMIRRSILPLVFTISLFVLFAAFIPDNPASVYLKNQYISHFQSDIGGENAVTAVYLGYRVYDTLLEALMLLIAVVAVAHLSWYQSAADGKRRHVNSKIALPVIRIISPLMLLCGVYLIANGHMSPGGGFQGGVLISSFFICRYLVYDIYDIKISKFISAEKIAFIGIVLLSALFILAGAGKIIPLPKSTYLTILNALIGMKVALGFITILYRYIAFERR